MIKDLIPKGGRKGILKDIIIIIAGVIIIWVGLQAVFGTQNPFYVVSSGSMIPELQVFDVLVVNGNDPFEEVQVGDIIVFNRPQGEDRVIVHRVASIIDDNPLTIRTKGDANPASIPGTDFPITEEEYIGQVAYVVPQVGYITRILTPPINYIIIAIIIGVIIAKQYSSNKKSRNALESLDSDDDESDSSNENPTYKADNVPKDTAYSKPKDSDHTENDSHDTKSDPKSRD